MSHDYKNPINNYLPWLKSAVSVDNVRPAIKRIADDRTTGVRYLVATDTHRLHVLRVGDCEAITTGTPHPLHKGMGIPDGVLDFELGTLFYDDDGKQVMYPNWQRVQPADAPWSFVVNAKALRDVCKALKGIAANASQRCILRYVAEKKLLTLSVFAEVSGATITASAEVLALDCDRDITTAVNLTYLADAAKIFDHSVAMVFQESADVNGNTRPFVLMNPCQTYPPTGILEPYAVIMPMSLS